MDDKIINDLKDHYGLVCHNIIQINGGWLNKKWKVSSNHGEFLVKQFSNKRFNNDKLKLIEAAMQRQNFLSKNTAICPSILQYKGHAIRLLDDEINYMVMEFCSGKVENSKSINLKQMYSLGYACGLMHTLFSQLPVISVEGYPIDNRQLINSLWQNFHTRKKESLSINSREYQKAVLLQIPILNQLNINFFEQSPKGITHEDFTSDNILFNNQGVSAIIDFDRNCYSFLWHDIGRAILSFALEDNKLNIDKVAAFIEGYCQHYKLTLENIVDALRLSWYIEIPWWIRPEFFIKNRGKATRFKNEICWLSEHWFELESLLRL